jgi:hypothetical protein
MGRFGIFDSEISRAHTGYQGGENPAIGFRRRYQVFYSIKNIQTIPELLSGGMGAQIDVRRNITR